MTNSSVLNEISVYVGTYEKYNNGSTFGKWLKLANYENHEEFINACLELHNDEKDPELMFQDWEFNTEEAEIFKGAISEYGISEKIWETAELLEGKDVEIISAYIQATGEKLTAETIKEAEENFIGEFNNDYDLGWYFAVELGNVVFGSETAKSYFDFERFGRELSWDLVSFNGYYFYN